MSNTNTTPNVRPAISFWRFAVVSSLLLFVLIPFVKAQTGYIYVTKSTVDESSNPTSGGFAFTGLGTGTTPGTTVIAPFTLNDAPTFIGASDLGAASTGTLFAATANGLYYRQANSATWVLGAGTTSGTFLPSRVDGCTGDQAVYINTANNNVYLYSISTNSVTSLGAVSNLVDIAFDRVNNRVIVSNTSNQFTYGTLSGTTISSYGTVAGNTGSKLDVDKTGNLIYLGTDGNLYKAANYTATSPTVTAMGKPSPSISDVAAADDGSIFVSTGGAVYKYAGSSGSFTSEPQAGYSGSITGGPGGQVWETYTIYGNNIFTRVLGGTTPNWLDDERIRTTVNSNSEMIAVAPGTYTITETPGTPNANWNLQKITIYDPGNTGTSNVTSSTTTVTVTAGEVVHIIYQNYYAATTAFNNDCGASSFTETFGTGTSGTLSTIATGDMVGATSYHFYGSGTPGSVQDGYYGITTTSLDAGFGATGSYVNSLDHKASSVAAGGLNQGGSGNFLFVNASFQTDVFYQREFTGLVPGNPYTITYYILNVTGSATLGGTTSILPINVTAEMTDPVSGTVLQSQSTGNITTIGVWTKETFTFTPGTLQTAANFLLVNNQIGGNGNDIGIDDITFKLAPSPSPAVKATVTCNGTGTLTVTSPVGAQYRYSLDGGIFQTSPVFTGVAQGSHTLSTDYLTTSNCSTTLNTSTSYVWAGTTSTDPTVASNWTGGVAPVFDGTENITIPVVTGSNYPVLTANESISGLTLGGTPANLNLNGKTLNVGCNIVNSTAGGVLNSSTDLTNSTINWNGTVATQTYTGNSTAGSAKLGNMTVNNTYNNGAGVVTMGAGPIDIYNVLKLTEGSLTISDPAVVPNTQLTLKSLQTQTAALAQIQSPGTGISVPVFTATKVNVERYISGGAAGSGYRGYRLLSSPVWTYNSTVASSVNCYPINYVNTTVGSNPGALTGGAGSGSNPNSNGFTITNPFGNPTLYLYDESRTSIARNFVTGKNIGITNVTSSYVVITGNATTVHSEIPVGNSYIFFFIGNNANLSYLNTRTIEPTTITATGTVNQGNITVHLWNNIANTALSYTAGNGSSTIGAATNVYGLNQVGNPYPSTISLDLLSAQNTSIGTTFWELKEPSQNYVSYIVGGATSSPYASKYIASGQGFLAQAWSPSLHAGVSSTLTFQESFKVNQQLVPSTPTVVGSPALLLSIKHDSTALTGLHLQLTKDSINATYTGIYFNAAKGSDKFNSTYDAVDLDGPAPVIYLSSYKADSTRVSINQLGDYMKGKRIKLFVKATASANYQLSLYDVANIDTLHNIYLVDHLQKDSVDLREKGPYSFAINTADTTTFGANRFELVISLKQLPPYKLLTFAGQKVSSGVQLAWKTQNESDYTGFTLEKLSGTQFAPLYNVQSNSASAYGFVDSHPVKGINTYRLKQDGVIGDITYSQVVTVNYTNLPAGEAFIVYPNPAGAIINVAVSLSSDTYTMNIYNSIGVRVLQQTITGSFWTDNVSQYVPGMYVVELYNSKGKFVGKTKFVKL